MTAPARVRVTLPMPLCLLARIDGEIALAVERPVTARAILDALDARYPVLRGTIREHETLKRRPKVRFYADGRDVSHEPPETPLPEAIASGAKPFMIVGAISGG